MKLRMEGAKVNSLGDIRAVISVLRDNTIDFQDTLNLASATSRSRLTKSLKAKYPDIQGDIEATLLEFINEASKQAKEPAGEEHDFPDEELEAGARLLETPDLLNTLLKAVNAAGHVGENVNKKAIILSAISTRAKKGAMSDEVKGASSSGKSALVNHSLSICPASWLYKLSRITTNALFYLKGKDLSRKVLFVDEAAGTADSDYSLRLAISEGELILLVTNKDAQGQLVAEEIKVPAENMAYVSTTTKLSLHPEMETRVIDLYVDESQKQTKDILKAEATEIDAEGAQRQRRVAQAALYQLEVMDVVIRFAVFLADNFPTGKVRARRDFPKLLNLIQASAVLHQKQREVLGGKIVATLSDYSIAKEIADVVIAQTLKDLSPQEETVLDTIKSNFEKDFTVRELYKHTSGLSNQRLKNIVGQLKEKSVISWNGEEGWKSKYTFVEDPRETLKLPSVEELVPYMSHPLVTDITEMDSTHGPRLNLGNISESDGNVTDITEKGEKVGNIGNKSVTMLNVTEMPKLSQTQKLKSVTSVTGGKGDTPQPTEPCLICGGNDWWLSGIGRWVCNQCFRDPYRKEKMPGDEL